MATDEHDDQTIDFETHTPRVKRPEVVDETADAMERRAAAIADKLNDAMDKIPSLISTAVATYDDAARRGAALAWLQAASDSIDVGTSNVENLADKAVRFADALLNRLDKPRG